MALKFFILYAGLFLFSSLALIPLIRQMSSSFSNRGKRPWIFSFVASALSSGAAFAITYITQNLFTTFWLLGGLFLVLGFLFVLLVHKKYFRARHDNRNKQLFSELLFGCSILFLCVALFSSLQYFLKDRNFMYFPMLLCMLFFFIPVLVLHTFDAAINIPRPDYPAWQYPEQTLELPDEKEGEHLYVIWFEIAKKLTDTQRTFFRGKAPEDMLLGDLFYHFINEYNEDHSETPIEYKNDEKTSEWQFRTRSRWYNFSKVLDAASPVARNPIKENTIIICERVQ
ncbi:TssN family type VI secretion system protein [Niabella beijingensis]|uniref:TssN family type VI secretion system protein n=1 Tax=Niabella beijingensis TaxID=2872700 RepID=UPI001CBB21C5|nr:TssN family type VI secretion system protein [Niabella beijingensis]MBZ4188377.1 TssN family type VI secretion system protein [Niabella beijingensis]